MAVVAPTPALSSAPETTSSYIVMLSAGAGDPAVVAAGQAAALGFTVGYVYRSALTGFAADLTPSALAALRADARVVAVEADQVLAATAVVPPGIDRVEADQS
ncbi:MAG: protease inhibitor I9 family protein, partial [Acidimicrobiales bacterium]